MLNAQSNRSRLRATDVVGVALRTYRAQFRRVASTAFIVFGTVAAVDAMAVSLVQDRHLTGPVGAVISSLLGTVVATIGVVIYAGILDKVVGAHLHGHADLTLRQIVRVLPLRRLVAADIVLALATVVGLLLFVLPGIFIFTMWSLVGPVITIEERSVRPALRRSWCLVRGHFWLTLLIVTIPLEVEQAVLHAIHYADVFEYPFVPAFIINGLLGMVIGSVVGLIEVVLAYELIARAGGDDEPDRK